MIDLIIVAIIVGIASGIVWYLWKAKKRGEKCVGCPYSRQCKGNCGEKESQKNNENINPK